ncbi:protein FAM161A [Dryobates pubescens]|uniref:protein FAM161A n=1 Tax=Dryobates pubescens TaxID=118200 RepID=UPI0023BA18D8|nr:protein FAM161A [Dryobates pubescens]
MEAAHRAARLAASCLCTPLDPRTRAPAALYERRPPHADAQDSFDLDTNTNKEKTRALNGDSDKWIDLSKMYNSNQEYYLKLEELKNAHLETMAKLESMYQNKLYLKGVQPLDKKSAGPNACCRPTWEKSSYQPLNLHKSFSDSDLSDPLRSSLSDESDRELAFEESSSETGSSAFAKERIEKMWDGFSVDDYISHIKHSLPSSPVVRTICKKQKAWSPKVTVPKPFQMTIREARKKEQNIKSKSQIEMENNLLKKQLEEEAECQKKFRANPVPAAVFLPLYHEIVQQNEERRRSVKERSKLKLLASQKPFKFIEREKQRNEIRKKQLKDLSAPEKKKLFRAKPVPKYIYSPSVKDKLKEEELYREIRIRMRAEELLRNSSLPNSRLALTNANKKKKHKCIDPKETEHKPKTKSSVPDFDLLHQKSQEQLLQRKQVKHLTVCEPFDLRTPYIPSNKGKVLKDIQEDEEKLKETRWPYTSLRCKTEMRHSNTNSHLSGSGDFKSPKSTESTRRRQQAVRNSLEEKRKLEEQQKRTRTKQKQRTKKLQRIVAACAEANDPHQSLAQMSKSKLQTFRNYEKQRMQEYLQELQEMEERLKQRPLLFERVTQKNARIAAEKHYSNRLRALGICPEFVSRKGQRTKLLQCSSVEDLKSTDTRERIIMDKVEERDYFEEAADSSSWSEQSCEEEKEEEEGERTKGAKTSSPDGPSTELEDEEEARDSPHIDQPCHAGKAGSSSNSHQHHEEENKEEEKAKVGLSLGHSQDKEEDNDWSRPSSQSNQSHEYEEAGQSYSEAEDAFRYEDEEYESDDSEEKPSSDEAD